MMARRCDRCGGYYSPRDGDRKAWVVLRDTDRCHDHRESPMDLCLECEVQLWVWLRNAPHFAKSSGSMARAIEEATQEKEAT